ncbi:hypothetical protein BpHYR1_028342 [Brachionus plicatilis]|uniref:Uncharacterized protein n=1 Tax=Brachionus plicatilis TaxID=10195 RepID=A0A3M7P9X5_BRAPC|nr:hypothetical protein BpHYR1_028342 [Brachionus plicatilis]
MENMSHLLNTKINHQIKPNRTQVDEKEGLGKNARIEVNTTAIFLENPFYNKKFPKRRKNCLHKKNAQKLFLNGEVNGTGINLNKVECFLIGYRLSAHKNRSLTQFCTFCEMGSDAQRDRDKARIYRQSNLLSHYNLNPNVEYKAENWPDGIESHVNVEKVSKYEELIYKLGANGVLNIMLVSLIVTSFELSTASRIAYGIYFIVFPYPDIFVIQMAFKLSIFSITNMGKKESPRDMLEEVPRQRANIIF